MSDPLTVGLCITTRQVVIVDLPLIENVVALFNDEVLVVARRGGKINVLKKEMSVGGDMIKGELLKKILLN